MFNKDDDEKNMTPIKINFFTNEYVHLCDYIIVENV